jgi:rhodanese-related sulfurtransferase
MMKFGRWAIAATLLLGTAACTVSEATPTAQVADSGVRVVEPAEAAAVLDDAPADLVVLDIRTPEEFAGGHLPGAVNLDFYEPDFRQQLAELDRDVPYILYCRSGNRSGQARQMMQELGFADVVDVAGGIVAWQQAGLPLSG